MLSMFGLGSNNKPTKTTKIQSNNKPKKPEKLKNIIKNIKLTNSSNSSNSSNSTNNSNMNQYIQKLNNYAFYNNYLNKNLKNKFEKKIGLYDPLGKNINPLTGKEYQNYYSTLQDKYPSGPLVGKMYQVTYKNLAYNWTNLPMYSHVSKILKSIRTNNITMIKAGTGVGKTVIVPKVALQAFNFQKRVICTVPKRVLARKNAEYSAKCLDVLMGQEVGYFVSGNRNMNANTKLVFTTAGSLKSLITNGDNLLSEYDCAIIDEVHERTVDTDFLILLMKEIIKKRPDFKLILMSATIDTKGFENYYLKNDKNIKFNTIEIEGVSHEVKIDFEKKQPTDWIPEAVKKTIDILKSKKEGDILIFMKASRDGKNLKSLLESKVKEVPDSHPFITLLDSKTSDEDKDYAIDKFKYKTHPSNDPNNPFDRKIVISTNVAESSVTIDGVVFVIDNGLHMESSYNPILDSRSLLEEYISKASSTQRKGRAGRTQPGTCYRLFTESEYEKFPDFTLPDIQKTDICTDMLDLLLLKYIKNIGDLKNYLNGLMDPPKDIILNSSFLKLYTLGAITSTSDTGVLTDLGKAISKFRKFEPNISKALLVSAKLNCLYDVAHIVLIGMAIDNRFEGLFLQYRPSKRSMSNKEIEKEKSEIEKKQKKFYSSYGDFISLLNIYNEIVNYMKKHEQKNINNGNNSNNGSTNKETNSNSENESNKKVSAKKLHRINNKTAKMWCIQNGIRPNIFVSKDESSHWDAIKSKTRDITTIIKKIMTSKNLENIDNVLINNESNKISQKGGNVINNTKTNILKDPIHNIILSFCIGGITNIAKLHDKKSFTYKTCYPIKNTLCKIDRNSSLTIKNASQYVIYNELFMARKGINILKLNLVSKIPADVLKVLKTYYKKDMDKCDRKIENNRQSFSKKISKKVIKKPLHKKTKFVKKK